MTEHAARSMRALAVHRRARTAAWARRVAMFSAALFVVAGLGHRFGYVETPPFLNILAIVGILALLGLLLAIMALVRIWRRGDRGLASAIVGAFVAIVVLVPFGVSLARALVYPQLHDISTDLDNPPQFSLVLKERGDGMNPISPATDLQGAAQMQAYPDVTGRRYEYQRDKVLQAVDAVLSDRGWRVLGRIEAADGDHAVTIEAVASTFLLGFKCDVAIRVFDDSRAAFVDMRSVSRYGRGDLGDNAHRIEGFMKDLDDRMAAMSGL